MTENPQKKEYTHRFYIIPYKKIFLSLKEEGLPLKYLNSEIFKPQFISCSVSKNKIKFNKNPEIPEVTITLQDEAFQKKVKIFLHKIQEKKSKKYKNTPSVEKEISLLEENFFYSDINPILKDFYPIYCIPNYTDLSEDILKSLKEDLFKLNTLREIIDALSILYGEKIWLYNAGDQPYYLNTGKEKSIKTYFEKKKFEPIPKYEPEYNTLCKKDKNSDPIRIITPLFYREEEDRDFQKEKNTLTAHEIIKLKKFLKSHDFVF